MVLARVFPRKTNATPEDIFSFFDLPPLYYPVMDEITEVHISVAFSWDIPEAEQLAYQWEKYYPVKVGGPAFNEKSGEFVPGRYIKHGYVITSRGCPNQCWYCSVWKREGNIRELPITEGYNVLDDNLLACSESHIRSVFSMLKRQKERAQFTGGFEARLLKRWHIDLLLKLKPKQIFFAYDKPEDYEPLIIAGRELVNAGFTLKSKTLRCYVLIGYPKDTINEAESRLLKTLNLGFIPMAMLYRNERGTKEREWLQLQKYWSRPAYISHKIKAR